MTTHTTPTGRMPVAACVWRLLVGSLALAATALLGACGGGGGDTAGVGTGGTGSFSVGTVTGFGSVFVNGIRYEDNGARLIDDDGTVKVLGTDDNPLKIGMVVEVTGSVDDSGTVRSATQIAYGAEIKGPVTAVDAAAGTFNVFGITVRTTTTTVYDNFGGVATLAAGNVVEVHGQPDTNGRIVATYVEREATSVDSLRGRRRRVPPARRGGWPERVEPGIHLRGAWRGDPHQRLHRLRRRASRWRLGQRPPEPDAAG